MTTETQENRFNNTTVGLAFGGTKITLPDDPHQMKVSEAIESLKRIEKEQETVVSVNEIVKAFPFDGAYAFMKAMKQIYGWATAVPTPSFFGPRPPQTISLEIEVGVTTQIIWGEFEVPGIEGRLKTGVWKSDEGMMYFCLQGQVKKKHMAEIARLANLTRDLVATESIYRGKAVQLQVNDKGQVDFNKSPKFIDLSRINEDELTFSEEVGAQVENFLWVPIEHTKACRTHKIPLKRGVLLEGPYGTGKTLTAFVTAKKAKNNGWTFVMIPQVSGLKDALQFSRLYQPAVLFAEDVDRAVTGERSVAMDDILNTIDGGESKGSEVITILTSNHVENINKAMLRPGRLDAIIKVSAPDAKAAEKLMRIYARETLSTDADLSKAGKELSGRIPAVIREAVERAKLYAVSRAAKNNSEKVEITGEDLYLSARGMSAHLGLLDGQKTEPTDAEKFYELFCKMVRENTVVSDEFEGLVNTVDEIQDTLN